MADGTLLLFEAEQISMENEKVSISETESFTQKKKEVVSIDISSSTSSCNKLKD